MRLVCAQALLSSTDTDISTGNVSTGLEEQLDELKRIEFSRFQALLSTLESMRQTLESALNDEERPRKKPKTSEGRPTIDMPLNLIHTVNATDSRRETYSSFRTIAQGIAAQFMHAILREVASKSKCKGGERWTSYLVTNVMQRDKTGKTSSPILGLIIYIVAIVGKTRALETRRMKRAFKHR